MITPAAAACDRCPSFANIRVNGFMIDDVEDENECLVEDVLRETGFDVIPAAAFWTLSLGTPENEDLRVVEGCCLCGSGTTRD